VFPRPDSRVQGFWRTLHGAADGVLCSGIGQPLTVIAATSGDTGSAVAHAFLGVSGIRVVILYPAGRVSIAQENSFTTLGQKLTLSKWPARLMTARGW